MRILSATTNRINGGFWILEEAGLVILSIKGSNIAPHVSPQSGLKDRRQ